MYTIDSIINKFQTLGEEYTLELLLDYSEKLPPLPEKYKAERDVGKNRVSECQTPVFLWVSIENELVRIHADVAPESPTVKGFVAILVDAFDGSAPEEVEAAPIDLLHQLGLSQKLGMMRTQGLTAVYHRIKNEVRDAYIHKPDKNF